MNLKTVLTSTYYFLLVGAVVGQIVYTVAQSSLVVDHSHQLGELETRKLELLTNQQKLTNTLAEHTSLASIQEVTKTQAYLPISKPVFIEVSDTVASR